MWRDRRSVAKARVRVEGRGAVRKGLRGWRSWRKREEEEIKSQELPEATAGGGVCEGRKREIIGEHLPAADRQ